MNMAKKKFYVVWHGQNTGIYDSWQKCQQQIKGFPGALYAGFPSKAAAEYAYNMRYHIYKEAKDKNKPLLPKSQNTAVPQLPKGSWAVDAACSGNPGKMEYQGVSIDDGSQIFHLGPFPLGTNNIGEFLAIVHALALLEKMQDHEKTIFTDSRIALGWVKKGKARTKLVKNAKSAQLHRLIERGEAWLKSHQVRNPIIKWNTKEWGEIPADFGRK